MKFLITDKFIIKERKSGDLKSTEPDLYVIVEHSDLPFPITVRMPYNALYDTTISPETHMFRMLYDPADIRTNKYVHDAIIGQFIKKAESEKGEYDTIPDYNKGQELEATQPGTETKTIRSQDGETVFSLADNAAYIKSGDGGIVVGQGTTSIYGDLNVFDFPSEKRFIAKESGIMRMLPKAFIPPLSFPDYIPDLTMIGNIYNMIETLSDIVSNIKKMEDIYDVWS